MKKLFFLFFVVLAFCGCATKQALIMPDKDFKQYKTAYIEILPIDQFNIGAAIIYQLSDLGLQVKNTAAPANPSDTDMKVKYSYTQGWDLDKYLHSFHIIFSDALTDSIIASVSYRLNGNWARTETRIRDAFDELRIKIGAKPTQKEKPAEVRSEL